LKSSLTSNVITQGPETSAGAFRNHRGCTRERGSGTALDTAEYIQCLHDKPHRLGSSHTDIQPGSIGSDNSFVAFHSGMRRASAW